MSQKNSVENVNAAEACRRSAFSPPARRAIMRQLWALFRAPFQIQLPFSQIQHTLQKTIEFKRSIKATALDHSPPTIEYNCREGP
jgi:hypothetical protein